VALDLRWVGCDLRTGRVIEELPGLQVSGSISRLLATYTSAQATLPLATSGPVKTPLEWVAATEPDRSMIVAVLAGVPVWAGIPVRRSRGSDPVVTLGLVSLEGYLDRRFTGDQAWTLANECSVIMKGLLQEANDEGIGIVIDAPVCTTTRSVDIKDQDDKTVYSALRTIMAMEDGPEWTIDLQWADGNQNVVSKIARVRHRIGQRASIPSAVFDVRPNAVLDSRGGASSTYEFVDDFTAGRGANHVIATSSGQGDTRPQSLPARSANLTAGLAPRWEHRFSPGSNITDLDDLDSAARSALALMSTGAHPLTITARADADPVLGTDWNIGDDIGYDVIGPGHPTGLTGQARAIGWTLDPNAGTVSPILLTPGDEVVS